MPSTSSPCSWTSIAARLRLGWRRVARSATLAALTTLAACGGGGGGSGGDGSSTAGGGGSSGGTTTTPVAQARALPAEYATRNAVNYAPFRSTVRDPAALTDAMVRQDLQLLAAGSFRLIRLFDSTDEVARRTLRVIRDDNLDIKVQLGVWIATGQDAANLAEIERGVALAREFSTSVVAVSVGNETMVSWSTNAVAPADMARYIRSVRDRVTQPVTTNDNWAFWASAPATILDEVDFVAMHSYPLADTVHNPGAWDWQQSGVAAPARAAAMMDAALARTQADYAAVRSHLDGLGRSARPVVIGETGWKAEVSSGEEQRAHPVNQKMMFDRLNAWTAQVRAGSAGPKAIFWFAAFDEPWKGADDKWGLFNVGRQARLAVQGLYPAAQWAPGSFTAADAVYYVPITNNPAVSASRYTLYADTVTAGEARPAQTPAWNAWENGTTGTAGEVSTAAAPADPTRSIEITPRPASWGWGLALTLPGSTDDLSGFAGTGRLNFSIRTTYPGTLEVGFLTGTAGAGSAYDVYLPLAPGQYGYRNDGTWCEVSIPVSAIAARGAMAFGMTDPAKSRLDLTKVSNPFVIADRYSVTGKAQGAGFTAPLQVDAIYWSK